MALTELNLTLSGSGFFSPPVNLNLSLPDPSHQWGKMVPDSARSKQPNSGKATLRKGGFLVGLSHKPIFL